jgi:HAD superfamily hydrolase (TIGR01509 family)
MIKGAIFDVDGTLVDSVDYHAQAWREIFLQFGRDVPFEAVRAQIGKGGDQLMPVFFTREELERIGKEMEEARGKLFKETYLEKVRPFPRVRELFERLRADGRRIALASSAEEDEVERHMRVLGVQGLVETRTSSDDAEKSKPHPDIFVAALERLPGVDASEAVVVGDSPWDAQAAGKIGLTALGVLCGGFPEADLRSAGCVEIRRDPADILTNYGQSLFGG